MMAFFVVILIRFQKLYFMKETSSKLEKPGETNANYCIVPVQELSSQGEKKRDPVNVNECVAFLYS